MTTRRGLEWMNWLVVCVSAVLIAGCVEEGRTMRSLSLSPEVRELKGGTAERFKAIATYDDGSTEDVTAKAHWRSSDVTVAEVFAAEAPGLVRAHTEGEALVTATVSGLSASTKLVITQAKLVSLVISPDHTEGDGVVVVNMPKGTTLGLKATGSFNDGSTQDMTETVEWASSDATKLSVSNTVGSKGAAAALAETGTGGVNITARFGSLVASATGRVGAAAVVSVEVAPQEAGASTALPLGTSLQLKAVAHYTDGTTAVVTNDAGWRTSSGSSATVGNTRDVNKGQVKTTEQTGASTIEAAFGGRTGELQVTVTDAELLSIEVAAVNGSPRLSEGLTLQFVATGNYTNGSRNITNDATWSTEDVEYWFNGSSAGQSVATVSMDEGSRGLVTALSEGKSLIKASLQGRLGHVVLTVTPPQVISIQVSAPKSQMKVGETMALTAIGTFDNGTTRDITSEVLWTTTNQGVADFENDTGSTKGWVTAFGPGSASISALYPGTNVYGSLELRVIRFDVQFIDFTGLKVDEPRVVSFNARISGPVSDTQRFYWKLSLSRSGQPVAGQRLYYPTGTEPGTPESWTQFIETDSQGTALYGPAEGLSAVEAGLTHPDGVTHPFRVAFNDAGPHALTVELVEVTTQETMGGTESFEVQALTLTFGGFDGLSATRSQVSLTGKLPADFPIERKLVWRMQLLQGQAWEAVEGQDLYFPQTGDGDDHTTWTSRIFTDWYGRTTFPPTGPFTVDQTSLRSAEGHVLPFSTTFAAGSYHLLVELVDVGDPAVAGDESVVGSAEKLFTVAAAL